MMNNYLFIINQNNYKKAEKIKFTNQINLKINSYFITIIKNKKLIRKSQKKKQQNF